MKKTSYFILGSMSVLAVLVAGALVTSAATSTSDTNGNSFFGKAGARFKHEGKMEEMFSAETYDDWKSQVETQAEESKQGVLKILEVVTPENFDEFKNMHELMKSGDMQGAKAIADELGLPQFEHKMFIGFGGGGVLGSELQTALESGDYSAWKTAVEKQTAENGREPKMLGTITEENFSRFAEMHRLMKSGDVEGAKVIAQELGLPEMGGKMMERGMMFKNRAEK